MYSKTNVCSNQLEMIGLWHSIKDFSPVLVNTERPFRDHPFGTSALFKGVGVKILQNLSTYLLTFQANSALKRLVKFQNNFS